VTTRKVGGAVILLCTTWSLEEMARVFGAMEGVPEWNASGSLMTS
jgi:hypothetical protein